MVHSTFSLSLYGDDQVLDDKSKYMCYALVITIWRLYVLKHIVERSTHMFSGVTPERGQVTSPRHTSPFLPQIKDAFYTVFVARCLCWLSARTPFTQIHHTLKGKHILITSAMIYKYMCFRDSPIYLRLVVSSTS
jgi:hypothetical protein